jgi:hypothetical protein
VTTARFLRVLLLAAVSLALTSGLAVASGGPVYTGGSTPYLHRMHMQITLYLEPGHRAGWEADIEGPCPDGSEMGRAIGTTTSLYEPKLQLQDGWFKLHRVHTDQTSDIHYRYTVKGHRTRTGFAGTLNYVETDNYYLYDATTCGSGLLHWTAHRYVRTW